MEPFDYPANNPGPHTLLSELSEGENVDNLHWLMTRFAGYVGVDELSSAANSPPIRAALTPVLSEIAARGLLLSRRRLVAAQPGARKGARL